MTEDPQTQVITAKTVDEAIEVAMHELDAARDEVEIEVLSRGKVGFLGIGSENARIRVRKLSAQEDDAGHKTMEVVSTILELAGASAVCTLRSAHDTQSGGPQVDIEGEDAGLLIGRRGETLRSLQFIVNVIVNRNREKSVRVLLDVEEYRLRRDQALQELAQRVASKVSATGQSISLEPMSPAERRMVHLALANNPSVTTESSGWGNGRRVSINPKENSEKR